MSKTGQWVFEMQEAAYDLTREEFIAQYGAGQANIWDEVNGEDRAEPEFERYGA